jgi:hypothetical protein
MSTQSRRQRRQPRRTHQQRRQQGRKAGPTAQPIDYSRDYMFVRRDMVRIILWSVLLFAGMIAAYFVL